MFFDRLRSEQPGKIMNHTEQRKKLRALLAGSKCLSPASIYDALSARIAEAVGYEIGMLAGSVVAKATLAAPDLCVHTLTEYADQIRRIMRVSGLSLFVDADNGYGNALNVMRTVQELEHAGVSGLSIEDTALPLSFGQAEDEPRLISIEEGVGKMRAAVAARGDPSLVIAGRTPALGIEGIESAVARAKAYAEAGVDVIFLAGEFEKAGVVVGPQTLARIQAIHAAAKLPIIVNSKLSLIKREELAACGVRIMLQFHHEVAAAAKTLREYYTHLFTGGAPADLKSKLASAQEMEQLVNGESYKQWLREYMR
jgi:carboxyvinyl-carboxyphosphonate phosphorylmutase